jgi:peptidoglycan/LPS O-acetylase OafA/YrhL
LKKEPKNFFPWRAAGEPRPKGQKVFCFFFSKKKTFLAYARYRAMPAKQDIPALTGLRGAAALWVAAYHLLLPAHFVTGRAAAMLGRGYLAVDLFFVLSGFVMALSYGHLFAAGVTGGAFGRFLWRRLARLYPLYGLILVTRFAYTALRYHSFDLPRPWIAAPLDDPAWDMPANLLMVQSWGLAGSSIGTAWSISAEWGAYWLFPILATLVLWRRWTTALATLAAAAALILAVALLDAGSGTHAGVLDAWNGLTAGPMMRCLGGFTLGMGLWRLAAIPRVAAIANTAPFRAGVLLALTVLVATGAPDLAIYPILPLLVLTLACTTGPTLFATPALVWLGDISYALYLLHIFLLHPLDVTRAQARLVLPDWAADAAAPALIAAILLAAAHLAHHVIERPGRRLMMRLADRQTRPRQAAALTVTLTPTT